MCTTAELVKFSRGSSSGIPILQPTAMNAQFRPMPFQPLQIISTQPGGHARMLGPAIIPRLPGPNRLPIRTLSPMNMNPNPTPNALIGQHKMNSAAPPPTPASQSTLHHFHQKPKFQVQANAVNVPDSVRKSMAPPPVSEPEQFKVPSIAQQKLQLAEKEKEREKERKSLIPNRLQTQTREKIEKNVEAATKAKFADESCLPSDLLDDQDADDSSAVVTHHPPAELLGCSNLLESEDSEPEETPDAAKKSKEDAEKIEKMNSAEITFREGMSKSIEDKEMFPVPIGHGRANRNRPSRNSQSDEYDFDFLNAIPNDWSQITKKLTPEQIPNPRMWENCRISETSKNARNDAVTSNHTIATQTEEQLATADDEEEKVIIATGTYVVTEVTSENKREHWNRKTTDVSVQVTVHDLNSQDRDGFREALSDLCTFFPTFKLEELEYFLTVSEGNLSDAIDRVIAQSSECDDIVQVSEFALDENVIETYNSNEDEFQVDKQQADNRLVDTPVTIQDAVLFQQLAARFGAPEGISPDELREPGMFAAIPASLAREIYDWWVISSMDGRELRIDRRLAKEVQDEEVAKQVQREWNEEQLSLVKPAAPSSCKETQEAFPPLSSDSSRVVSPSLLQGNWQKAPISQSIKMEKLSALFPHVPEDRLVEILHDNGGAMECTIKTICHLLDKDPREVEREQNQPLRTQIPRAHHQEGQIRSQIVNGHQSVIWVISIILIRSYLWNIS